MSIPELITWPFSWLLLTFYETFANYGIAIILFSVVIKLIFLPFQMKSKRSMMRSTRLTPLMKDLEKKYEGDKQKYQEAVAKMYKEEGINPMSGCLWALLPFPILIMLYSVIRQPLTSLMGIGEAAFEAVKNTMVSLGAEIPDGAYAEIEIADFVHNHFSSFQGISDKLIDLDFTFLEMNLGSVPNWQLWNFNWSDSAVLLPALGLFCIPILSAVLSYLSMKVSNVSNPAAAAQQGTMKSMAIMMPAMSLYFCFIMPAAMGIYWIMNSLLAMIQDLILNKYYGKIIDAEDAERRERIKRQEAEMERKRLETERLRELGATERNKNTSKKKLQAAEKTKNEERLASEHAAEKAARRAALGVKDEIPASQVGNRRFARGRAYVEDRYTNPEGAQEATENAAALSEIDEQADSELEPEDTGLAAEAEGGDEESGESDADESDE